MRGVGGVYVRKEGGGGEGIRKKKGVYRECFERKN